MNRTYRVIRKDPRFKARTDGSAAQAPLEKVFQYFRVKFSLTGLVATVNHRSTILYLRHISLAQLFYFNESLHVCNGRAIKLVQ